MATGSPPPPTLTELAGGIAHDLNNSLTSILSLTELVTAHLGEGPHAPDLREIDAQARRAATLVHRLLDATQRQALSEASGRRSSPPPPAPTGLGASGETGTAGGGEPSAQPLRFATAGGVPVPASPAAASSPNAAGSSAAHGSPAASLSPAAAALPTAALPTATPPEPWQPPLDGEGLAPPGEPSTVLVADDEPSIRRLLARVLAAAGYQVHTAETGEELASLLESQGPRFDLALVDVRMPGRGGLEVYGDLRQRYPRMRVIFMSGYPATAEDYRRLYEWGATFLRKPFSIREVEQRVAALLSSAATLG